MRSGRGFRYEAPTGDAASEDERDRIAALVIPPAWTDVWISVEPLGHIQAVGTDDAGRRQYLYHPLWRERRDKGKFARALALAAALPSARRQVTRSMHRTELDRERVLAVSFRLLDTAAPRIGSARYLEKHGSRGLTTLERRDAAVEASTVTLSFPGKSGKRAWIEVDDEDLADVIAVLVQGRPRSSLLAYRKGSRRVALKPSEVNDHVRSLTGGAFTAKDFRTLHGTIVAAQSLARIGLVSTDRERRNAETLAVRATSDALGNTPAVARSSYIDPRVFARYARGHVIDLDVTPESGIRSLLGGEKARRGDRGRKAKKRG
ncbi:DNA topoisomerase IB [Microbacterium aoyamense]|uniref:DNA topoisomerase IB n=1 Tax=Microbacterium aoyamense TaxID=344166 RepID=UPI0020053342|nr:DNA topoisomerase IB [Microbacterium aoyamense]